MASFVRSRWPWSVRSQSKTTAVEADADFPGGNIAAPRFLSPHHLQFAAAAHGSPRPLWFYFRVRHAPGPQLHCELTNADECLGPPLGWRNARPVYSRDGTSWTRVESGEYLQGRGRFRFQVPITGDAVWVAYCYPYTGADLDRILATLTAPAQVSELCRSEGGRPVPYVRFGNQEQPRSVVWIIARQHAGETPASFTVEGLLKRLGNPCGTVTEALHHTAVHVVPMVDVDGVEAGWFGKDQTPIDFNRDWRSSPSRPATRAMIEQIRASRLQAPITLALDLHAPHHGDPACYFFADQIGRGRDTDHVQAQFLEFLGLETPERVGFRPGDLRKSPPPLGSARQFFANELAAPALTLEMSYHQAQSGNYLRPDDYQAFGHCLARSIARLSSEWM